MYNASRQLRQKVKQMKKPIVKYEVEISVDDTLKNLAWYKVICEGVTTSGQAESPGRAMILASDAVYNQLQAQGLVK